MTNAGLMNLVYVPKIIFPLTNISVNTFKFLIILSLFLVFMQFKQIQPSTAWILLPVLILVELLLIVGVTSLLAAIMPFFPGSSGYTGQYFADDVFPFGNFL